MAGPLLSEFITADGPRRGPELEALAIGIATGLTVIHQAGLVHGDFGPDYVALGMEGPRVVGFGITPPYGMATPSADMLAWAHVVLYAASGRPVGRPAGLALLAEPLRSSVAQCAAPDPAARPSARQVVLRLLGEDNPPVGVLAEGARRATRAGVRTAAEQADSPSLAATRPQRAKAIGWAAAAIVCVVAIIVAVHVLAGSDRGAAVQPASVSQPDSANPTPPAGRSASPSPSVTIPAAVGGTWSGSVSQQGRRHQGAADPHRQLTVREDHLLRGAGDVFRGARADRGARAGAGAAPGDRRRQVRQRGDHAERRRAAP